MTIVTYDIQELTNQTGVSRRTIYFYVQQGLLPPPQGAGLAAHYTENHLLRLRLIPILRQQGLRLDEIRQKFQAMSTEELRQAVQTTAQPPAARARPGLPVLPGILPGWDQQRYTHYSLPGGITLAVPESASPADRQRVDLLLQAARQIFGGANPTNPPFVYLDSGQNPEKPDDGDSQPA
jgi:DNA-binding transcriptional MerR regulator